jgi:ERCC4-type nuclease
MRETSLMEIPGIGPTRARILLRRFGSLSGLAGADPTEIEEAVGPASARAVLRHLAAGRAQEEPVEVGAGPDEGGRARSA